MTGKRAYWIGGTATAFFGVGLVRLLAPELSGTPSTIAMASGYVLVVVGITLISFALAARLIRLVIGEPTESEAAGASLENLEIEGMRIEDPVAEIAGEGSVAASEPGKVTS